MLVSFLLLVLNQIDTQAAWGGSLGYKQKYLYDSSVASNGQEGRLKAYNESKWNDWFATKIEGRSEFTSIPLNLSNEVKRNQRNELFDFYPGESYFRVKIPALVAQVGYQEVVWGESFGFNSADFITPKNVNFTFLGEQEESRRPVPLVQLKHLGDNYSVQILYGAKPEFEKDYPIDLYFRALFPKEDIQVIRESGKWFDKHEGGGKVSLTSFGVDWSLFGYSYLDRKAVYELQSYNPNSLLVLNERHFRTQSYGTSFSTALGDFVVRGDFVRNNGKHFNYVNNLGQLKNKKLNENILSLSFDTPSYDGYSFFVVSSLSQLDEEMTNGFRRKDQKILSLKVQKEIDSENKIELVVFSEIEDKSNGVQASYNVALNNQVEIMFGAESYFGDKAGTSSRLKKFNSIFVKFKNFFNF